MPPAHRALGLQRQNTSRLDGERYSGGGAGTGRITGPAPRYSSRTGFALGPAGPPLNRVPVTLDRISPHSGTLLPPQIRCVLTHQTPFFCRPVDVGDLCVFAMKEDIESQMSQAPCQWLHYDFEFFI